MDVDFDVDADADKDANVDADSVADQYIDVSVDFDRARTEFRKGFGVDFCDEKYTKNAKQ